METSCYWSVSHCFFFVILNSPEFVLETYKVVRHVITQRNTLKASFQELPLLNNISKNNFTFIFPFLYDRNQETYPTKIAKKEKSMKMAKVRSYPQPN